MRPLTGRHVYSLDDHGVVRVAIEGAAEALERRVVAPALWYALLGLPGLMLWTASDGLAHAIGGGPGTTGSAGRLPSFIGCWAMVRRA